MKITALELLKVLKTNPKESINYFSQIALGEKIVVKFGFDKNSISITFFITGKSNSKNLCISKKIDKLFETDNNFEPLNNYLPNIKKITKYHFSPYLKINNEPEMYAAMIGFEHIKE